MLLENIAKHYITLHQIPLVWSKAGLDIAPACGHCIDIAFLAFGPEATLFMLRWRRLLDHFRNGQVVGGSEEAVVAGAADGQVDLVALYLGLDVERAVPGVDGIESQIAPPVADGGGFHFLGIAEGRFPLGDVGFESHDYVEAIFAGKEFVTDSADFDDDQDNQRDHDDRDSCVHGSADSMRFHFRSG
jgi:hypothetical protein